MFEPWVISYIKDVAKEELKGKKASVVKVYWDTINLILEKWKFEGDDGRAVYARRSHGLGTFKNDHKIKSFEEADPWESAGLEFPSRIGMVFKLHDEKYPDYMAFLKNADGALLFALLIDRETNSCSDTDWFAAYDLLICSQLNKSMIGQIRTWNMYFTEQPLVSAGTAQKRNLAKGNAAASNNKAARAQHNHEHWRKWAQEKWDGGNSWTTADTVLDEVCALAEEHGHKMANGKPYARKTIQDGISGIKKFAKRRNECLARKKLILLFSRQKRVIINQLM